MTESTAVRPSAARVVSAFAAVYVIWGSTYLAVRFAIETLPPLLMAGVRFLLAGAILFAVLRFKGEAVPTRREWRNAAVVGGLLLLGGNGGVVMAERTVPSGVVALLVAMVPLWMVLLEWARPGGVRPSPRTVAGLVMGFGGMMLLVNPGASGGRVDPFGAAFVVLGSLAWAGGSIFSRGAALPKNAFMATAAEMMCGGALLLVVGTLRGEWSGFDASAVTGKSAVALLYLLTFGSLVGFTAYIWLLGVTTAARASTYAYVNPVVAVLLGWAMAGEDLSPRVLMAMAVIVGAVAVITTGKRASRETVPVEERADAGDSPHRRKRARRRAAA